MSASVTLANNTARRAADVQPNKYITVRCCHGCSRLNYVLLLGLCRSYGATQKCIGAANAPPHLVSIDFHVDPPGLIAARCTFQIWMVEADTVIESVTTIDTFDVVFLVYPGVRLVFRAPAVSLKRGPVSEALVFVCVLVSRGYRHASCNYCTGIL